MSRTMPRSLIALALTSALAFAPFSGAAAGTSESGTGASNSSGRPSTFVLSGPGTPATSASPKEIVASLPVITVTGTLRKAIAHSVSSEVLEWVRIETPDGSRISINSDAPGLEAAEPGDVVSAQVAVTTPVRAALAPRGSTAQSLASLSAGGSVASAALTTAGALHVTALTVIQKVQAPPQSAHTAYVVVVADSAIKGHTLAAAKALTIEAASYWKAESLGSIAKFDVREPVTLRFNRSCTKRGEDPDAVWDAAEALYPKVNFNAGGNHLVVYTPPGCNEVLGYSGVGTVGKGITSGGVVSVSVPWLHVAVHELAHNLSLGHANLVVPVGAAPGVYPYMALYGPQALGVNNYAPGALDVGFQYALGVTPASMVRDVSASAETTMDLAPVSGTAGVRGATFRDPQTQTRYFLEYRSGADKDANSTYMHDDAFRVGGVAVDQSPGVRIYLIDSDNALVNLTAYDTATATLYTSFIARDSVTFGDNAFNIRVSAMTNAKASVVIKHSFVAKPRTKKPTRTSLSVKPSTYGTSAIASVRVTGTTAPAGAVAIYSGTIKVATATLSNGKASVKVPSTLTAGKHALSARYLGSGLNLASTGHASLTVAKAAAKVKVLRTTNLRNGTRATVIVRLTGVSRTSPTGTVTLKVGKKTMSKAFKIKKVKGRWQATIKTKKLPKGKVTVVYSGNKNLKKATYSAKRTLK